MVDVKTSNIIFIFVEFLKPCRFPFESPLYLYSIRLCILGSWCFGEIFLNAEGIIGKMEKKIDQPIDSGGRETYFGHMNLGHNFEIFFKIFLSPTTLENGEKTGTMNIYKIWVLWVKTTNFG